MRLRHAGGYYVAAASLLLGSIVWASTTPELASDKDDPGHRQSIVSTNKPSDTNSQNEVSAPINPALLGAPLSANTNLIPPSPAPKNKARIENMERELNLARRHRVDKEFASAERILQSLLEHDAPEEIHRGALLEFAVLAQDNKQWPKAQHIYAQYVQRFRDDPSVPEILLRQGLLYRDMGVPVLALSKFYAVMSSALSLKVDKLGYYQRLVLQAQTEIADTYYLEGKFDESADFFARLLKLDSPDLNRETVLFKLIRSLSASKKHTQAIAQAKMFLDRYAESSHVPEVRFLLAGSLKQLGHKREAMDQVLALLEAQRNEKNFNQETWLYWQQRGGNEIANQLSQEGDFVNALQIYLRLADINAAPGWRFPAWYQAALIFERLNQQDKAAEMYNRITEDSKDLGGQTPDANLTLVLQMAAWRQKRLGWEAKAALANKEISRVASPPSGNNEQ